MQALPLGDSGPEVIARRERGTALEYDGVVAGVCVGVSERLYERRLRGARATAVALDRGGGAVSPRERVAGARGRHIELHTDGGEIIPGGRQEIRGTVRVRAHGRRRRRGDRDDGRRADGRLGYARASLIESRAVCPALCVGVCDAVVEPAADGRG